MKADANKLDYVGVTQARHQMALFQIHFSNVPLDGVMVCGVLDVFPSTYKTFDNNLNA
jgi:hypothetical protein